METHIDRIIAELTLRSYFHNRRLSPHITPEDWTRIYHDAEAMERRFRAGGLADGHVAGD
jgi:hypothetical protein